jgi:hypothetical protein
MPKLPHKREDIYLSSYNNWNCCGKATLNSSDDRKDHWGSNYRVENCWSLKNCLKDCWSAKDKVSLGAYSKLKSSY